MSPDRPWLWAFLNVGLVGTGPAWTAGLSWGYPTPRVSLASPPPATAPADCYLIKLRSKTGFEKWGLMGFEQRRIVYLTLAKRVDLKVFIIRKKNCFFVWWCMVTDVTRFVVIILQYVQILNHDVVPLN